MSLKRGYARLTTRYGDIRVYLVCGPACRYAHAGYMLLPGALLLAVIIVAAIPWLSTGFL
jgi:hypothetical protein